MHTKSPDFVPLVLTSLNHEKYGEVFLQNPKLVKLEPWLRRTDLRKNTAETRGPKLGPLVLTLLKLKKAEQFCSDTKVPKFGSLVLTAKPQESRAVLLGN